MRSSICRCSSLRCLSRYTLPPQSAGWPSTPPKVNVGIDRSSAATVVWGRLCRSIRSSADPVDLGVQSHLIGVPEPRASRPSWADQIAAGRALLMTFYVTHRAAQDRSSPRQAGWGSGAGSAGRRGPARFCRRPGYGQVVVVAAGLSWAAVLVAFVTNPGTGYG